MNQTKQSNLKSFLLPLIVLFITGVSYFVNAQEVKVTKTDNRPKAAKLIAEVGGLETKNIVYNVNGQNATKEEVDKIDPKTIKSVNVSKKDANTGTINIMTAKEGEANGTELQKVDEQMNSKDVQLSFEVAEYYINDKKASKQEVDQLNPEIIKDVKINKTDKGSTVKVYLQ